MENRQRNRTAHVKTTKPDAAPVFEPDTGQHGRKGEPVRVKIEGDWKDAARKLLGVKAGSVPARKVKKRTKRAK